MLIPFSKNFGIVQLKWADEEGVNLSLTNVCSIQTKEQKIIEMWEVDLLFKFDILCLCSHENTQQKHFLGLFFAVC